MLKTNDESHACLLLETDLRWLLRKLGLLGSAIKSDLCLMMIFSNPSIRLFVQRFVYGPKFGFYRQHNLSFSLHPFRRLVFPHAHCSSTEKKFSYYLTLYESGWFIATLLPHGSLIVIWSQFRNIYFPWAHNVPDISIFRTRADGVRSRLATKPISTF